jgi:hypothetical protein
VREVGKQPPLAVEDLGAHGHAQLDIRPVRPVPIRALAVPPAAGLEFPLSGEVGEVAPGGVRCEHDIAASAAVPSVRPTLGHVLLAPKRERAIAPAAAANANPRAVMKHGAA